MGFPATGIKGFGMVNVCGRRRDPRPAMGTIIFMLAPYPPKGEFLLGVNRILLIKFVYELFTPFYPFPPWGLGGSLLHPCTAKPAFAS